MSEINEEAVAETVEETAEEIVEETAPADGMTAEELTNEIFAESSGRYVDVKDKYEDAKSTAITLLVVGIAELAFIICNLAGLMKKFPIQIKDQPILGVTFALMSVIFIVIGVYYVKKTAEYKEKIAGEEDAYSKIYKWFEESVSSDMPEFNFENDSQADVYFNRTRVLKDMLMREFEDADEALIDKIIDEKYDDVFED